MTNAEKFIEVMNATFGAGFTLDNLARECSPCGSLKIREMGCGKFTCDGCHKWWNKEYKAIPEQNPPLTLEELREMGGGPVWIKEKHCQMPYCDVLHNVARSDGRTYVRPLIHQRLQESGYGTAWLAYRRKPEEVHP